jgi:predicted dienelactone hydrolase
MPQIVDSQIINARQIPYPAKTLSNVPDARLLEFFDIFKSDVRTGREKIFVFSVKRGVVLTPSHKLGSGKRFDRLFLLSFFGR